MPAQIRLETALATTTSPAALRTTTPTGSVSRTSRSRRSLFSMSLRGSATAPLLPRKPHPAKRRASFHLWCRIVPHVVRDLPGTVRHFAEHVQVGPPLAIGFSTGRPGDLVGASRERRAAAPADLVDADLHAQ